MLSVSRIKGASRAAAYYGRDDYYLTGEADAPGLEWGGKGAEQLGLRGAARAAEFKAVLSGENPDPGGPPISSSQKGRGHHPGWDFTFSAPKSVSVAILVGGDARLDAAHDRAVHKAMDYAERNLSFTRIREPGARRDAPTGNLVYAKTVHGVSREGDPQRHTHIVIANTTWHATSKAWRALESRHLYRRRMLLGKIYQAELAKEALALGYDVRKRPGGLYELAAWTREQLKIFGKRTEAIRHLLEIEKPSTPAARDAVKLKNRPDKIERPRGELVSAWRREAEAAGLNVAKVVGEAAARPRGRDRTAKVTGRASEALSQLRAAIDHVVGEGTGFNPYRNTKRDLDRDQEAREAVGFALQVEEIASAVFTRHDVLERALDRARPGVALDRLEADLGRLERRRLVVPADRHLPGGVTTLTGLGVEAEILNRIAAGRGRGFAAAPREEVLRRLHGHEQAGGLVLNAGQRQAVATVLGSEDRYVAIQGAAGVGKTTMFRAVKALAADAAVELTAITPTHRAAMAMKSEADVHATTIAAWLATTQKALQTAAGRKQLKAHWEERILVIEEASMVSNSQMYAIMDAADRIGVGKVVMTGDERQIGSPEAGGPFRMALHRQVDQARMTTILRQRDPTLRESVAELAAGRPHPALQIIERYIVEAGRGADDRALAAAAVQAWKDGVGAGAEPRIIVPTNALRGLVAELVREHKTAAGELAAVGEAKDRYQQARSIGPERFSAASYRLGQRLVFHGAYGPGGIRRGSEVDVVGLDARNDVLRVTGRLGDRSIDLLALSRGGRSPFQAYWVRPMEVAEGERLVWERADPKRGLLTGAGFTVMAMDKTHWSIRHDDGREEQLRADDPALRFVGYGYAETADRAQGQTYRSVVAVMASRHGEAVSAARQYVMQSRPSEAFRMITDVRRLLVMRLAAHDGLNRIALEHIDSALSQPAAKTAGEELAKPEPQLGADRAETERGL